MDHLVLNRRHVIVIYVIFVRYGGWFTEYWVTWYLFDRWRVHLGVGLTCFVIFVRYVAPRRNDLDRMARSVDPCYFWIRLILYLNFNNTGLVYLFILNSTWIWSCWCIYRCLGYRFWFTIYRIYDAYAIGSVYQCLCCCTPFLNLVLMLPG